MIFCPLSPADNAAGDFFSGIPGGLGAKVVGHAVDHHCSPDHIIHPEPAGQHRKVGVAVRRKQRRQIPCVQGVGCFFRVKMAPSVGKPFAAAACAFVNVQGKKSRWGMGQTPYMNSHQGSVGMGLKFHPAPQPRCAASAPNIRLCVHCFIQINHPCHCMNGRGKCAGQLHRQKVASGSFAWYNGF